MSPFLRISSIVLFLALNACAEFSQVFEVQPTPHAVDKSRGFYYVVKEGETLSSIANGFRVSLQDLAEINDIRQESGLTTGQRIFVPSARDSRKSGKIQRQQPVSEPAPLVVNTSSEARFIWPVDNGVVSSRFGIRNGRQHDGIDISAPRGTPVKAAGRGRVVYNGRLSGYGNLVVIKHADNFFTAYAHLAKSNVKKGDKVESGKVIGTVGSTGHSSGPHCHFEIRQKTESRNPLFFLPKRE